MAETLMKEGYQLKETKQSSKYKDYLVYHFLNTNNIEKRVNELKNK